MPTPADADIILKLYDLRREAVMRKARDYILIHFWPQSEEEFQQTVLTPGEPNTYFRQVLSYWDMACSMANRGAVDAQLFFDSANEPFLIYTKFKKFIPYVRQNWNSEFLNHIEKFVTSTPEARERLSAFEPRAKKMFEMVQKMKAEKAKAS